MSFTTSQLLRRSAATVAAALFFACTFAPSLVAAQPEAAGAGHGHAPGGGSLESTAERLRVAIEHYAWRPTGAETDSGTAEAELVATFRSALAVVSRGIAGLTEVSFERSWRPGPSRAIRARAS